MTANYGYSHVNLATLNLDATQDFYEGVLGFETVGAGVYEVIEGGHLRHIYFDLGQGQLLSFLEPNDVEGLPAAFPTDINSALGLPAAFNHVAFAAGSLDDLSTKRDELLQEGVAVTEIVDHDWSRSIYFDDPVNGLKLEYCAIVRDLRAEDADMEVRLQTALGGIEAMMTPAAT